MDGTTINVDAQWITIEGLTLRPLTIPRQHALALGVEITKALKEQEAREAMEAEMEPKPKRNTRTCRLDGSPKNGKREKLSDEQRAELRPLYADYCRRCRAIGDPPETFDRWAGDAGDWINGRLKHERWTRENIADGLVRVRLSQYAPR